MDNEFRAFLDAPDAGPVKKVRRKRYNFFNWAVFLLLLTGFALASWIGSFYVFAHPEDPRCYTILTALNKIDPIKRFEVTSAPVGKFYTAKELYDTFATISRLEIEKKNSDLLRGYLGNYPDTKALVPYVAGRFKALGVYELKSSDMFPTGVVAVAESVDCPQVMIEQVYSTQPANIPKVRRMLAMSPEIILAKTFDLSAVVHAEKLEDGKFLFTVMPLSYGNYAFKQGISSTFRLDPPRSVNLEAGMPLIKPDAMGDAVKMFAQYRKTKGLLAQIKTPAFPDPTPQTVARSAGPLITPPPIVESVKTPQPAVTKATPAPVSVETLASTGSLEASTPAPVASHIPEVEAVAKEEPAVSQPAPVPSVEQTPETPASVASTQPEAQQLPANPLLPTPLPQVMINPAQQNAPVVPVATSRPVATPSSVVQSVAVQPQPQKVVVKNSLSSTIPAPSVARPVARVSPSPNLTHIIAAMRSPAPKVKPVYANASPAPARSLPVATPSATKTVAAFASQQQSPQTAQIAPVEPQSAYVNGVRFEPFMAAQPRQVQSIAQPAASNSTTPNTWRTYPPGQMPRGKLLDWQNAPELAEVGGSHGRFYIRGKYVVTASSDNRVILRPQGYAGEALSTLRVVVEFPMGAQIPAEGSAVARGEMRPFQIVDVRRGNDGQVNVYAREITTPWQVTNTADLLRSYHQQREALTNQYLR